MLNMIDEKVDITEKSIRINRIDKEPANGMITAYDPSSSIGSIELEKGVIECDNIRELVASQQGWIYDLHKFTYSPHQTCPPGRVTVRRADGQNLADST